MRPRPQSRENLFAERDLIAEKLRRQLRERRYLRVVVAVVSDRHPLPQLLSHQIGVCLGEIADHEERGAHPQLGQRRENARRVLRRGAVVEGQRDGLLSPRRPAGAEPQRDQLVREGAADDQLLAGRATDRELRVARPPAGHAHDAAEEWLAPVVTVGDGDPLAAPQPHPHRRGPTVDEEAAGNRRRAQHLSIHVEDITRARVQPEPCRCPGQRRPLGHVHRPTHDCHSQRRALAFPEKQPGKQRPDNHGDEHNRTHNAHSPQHHAPFTFVIRRTTLPEPAPPITRSYVSVAAMSP